MGLEPMTPALKVPCSTNWATRPLILVVRGGVEPPTPGSSNPCSTNWATAPFYPCTVFYHRSYKPQNKVFEFLWCSHTTHQNICDIFLRTLYLNSFHRYSFNKSFCPAFHSFSYLFIIAVIRGIEPRSSAGNAKKTLLEVFLPEYTLLRYATTTPYHHKMWNMSILQPAYFAT